MSKWGRAEIMIIRQCAGTMRVADIGQLIGRILKMPVSQVNQYVCFDKRVG